MRHIGSASEPESDEVCVFFLKFNSVPNNNNHIAFTYKNIFTGFNTDKSIEIVHERANVNIADTLYELFSRLFKYPANIFTRQ